MNTNILYRKITSIDSTSDKDFYQEVCQLMPVIADYQQQTGNIHQLFNLFKADNPNSLNKLIKFATLKQENLSNQSNFLRFIKVVYLIIEQQNKQYTAYSLFRYYSFTATDLDRYEHKFSQERYLALVHCACYNHDGYIREQALQKLTQMVSADSIIHIVNRLSDWVPTVRNSANVALLAHLKEENVLRFVHNLRMIYALKKVKRVDLSQKIQHIQSFINAHYSEWFPQYHNFDDITRLLLMENIEDLAISTDDKIQLLLNDKYFIIRTRVLKYLEVLSQEQIDKLLLDKSSNVRLNTLYAIKNSKTWRPYFDAIIVDYIADVSGSIRDLARFHAKKQGHDFVKIYAGNLQKSEQSTEQSAPQLVGALCGLAEVGARQYTDTVASYLTHDIIRVQKTAFLALAKLDKEQAYAFAVANFELNALKKVISRFLVDNCTTEVILKIRTLLTQADVEQKQSLLNLLKNIGGYQVINELMLASVDENANIRSLAYNLLHDWEYRNRAHQSRFNKQQRTEALQTFEQVYAIHQDKKYFANNPVEGFGYYLRH